MCSFRFTITTHYRKEVEQQLKIAQQLGNLHQIKYLLSRSIRIRNEQSADHRRPSRCGAQSKTFRPFWGCRFGPCHRSRQRTD
jgi:hypothetical protein